MELGIGLPNTVPGTSREELLEFARAAEEAGFSSLGTIDRIVYGNYEPLIALAGAASVTERIRLLTSILLAPPRGNPAELAKQALSLDALAGGGRAVLGLGVGGREDDYEVSGIPEQFGQGVEQLRAAWEEAGRDGEPRKMALGYFSLGPDAEKNAEEELGDYYAWLGEEVAGMIVGAAAKDAETVKGYMQAFESQGCDEFVFFPTSSDPEQVRLLAEAAGL
jgi:alkanesulfonate monooxygenase SsuD/methylene tetrahydromethanopterin reductase-like flavin-dependent oxidoreductase (luciferase family)